MKIGIVIPTYRGERFLEETLESIARQTYANWETVLVEDGSPPDTLAQVRALVERRRSQKGVHWRLVTQPNQGVAAARNTGFATLSPDCTLVRFLDHDDTLEPDALALQVQMLRDDPGAVAAAGVVRAVNEAGEPEGPDGGRMLARRKEVVVEGRRGRYRSREWEEPVTFASFVYDGCFWTPGAILFRRSALPVSCPFDPGIAPCDDWDLYLRVSRQGHFAVTREVVVNWRRHGANASGSHQRMVDGVWKVREKLTRCPDLTAEERLMMQFCFARNSAGHLRRDAAVALGQGRLAGAIRLYSRYLRMRARWWEPSLTELMELMRPEWHYERPEIYQPLPRPGK